MQPLHVLRAVTRCTLLLLGSNLLLALAQCAVGVFGSSQALIADALHTLSDALADAVVYATAVCTAQSPVASRRRVEALVRRLLGLLLLGTAVGLLSRSLGGLAAALPAVPPHPLAIACAGLVMLSKECMCRHTLLVARRVDAPLLVASAWHHRADALSSALVLVALIGARGGLPWLDPLAALVVAAMIAHAGLRLLIDDAQHRSAPAVPASVLSGDGRR